ncbi:MAG TPA: hypothetical protein VFR24_27415 [Candidatus Angelobacter sp.]|nr:hypothetical protein [Candidatus Angelobacter sp.]
MREIKDLGSTLRDAVGKLRQDTANAKQRFSSELAHTQANLVKVNALSQEMADANKEVEALLADTGSNFLNTSTAKPDQNGVVKNQG